MQRPRLPGGAVVKNLPVNGGDARDTGFDSWAQKIRWSRKWQPTPVFLPGKPHGQRSLTAIVHGVAKSQTQLGTVLDRRKTLLTSPEKEMERPESCFTI